MGKLETHNTFGWKFGGRRRRREDNTEMDVWERKFEGVDWIYLA
jgi:hypothetical protein